MYHTMYHTPIAFQGLCLVSMRVSGLGSMLISGIQTLFKPYLNPINTVLFVLIPAPESQMYHNMYHTQASLGLHSRASAHAF